MADSQGDLAKTGYLKVRRKDEKKFKKRWAVLRQESATMEIYESDKKWRAGDKCKMSIPLRPCFSVSTKVEPKCKFAIGLMGATSYSLGLETEEEQTDWLLKLRWVHQGGRRADDDEPRTQYERMWDVCVTDRGLGSTKKLSGQYCIGLTADGIQLINKENPKETYDLPFTTIRGCRHMECFFWMEVGRTSCFGAGEIYMQLEERIYAQNMHEVMKAKFNSRSSESDSQSTEPRPRAPSTSEPSRPISVKGRRNTYSSNNSSQASMSTISVSTSPGRDRAGSVPSRPRTASESNGHRYGAQLVGHDKHHARVRPGADGRPHAVHPCSSSMTAGSPPNPSSPFSPASVDSNSSYSMDDHVPMCHPIPPDSIIVEEAGDYPPVDRTRTSAADLFDGGGEKRALPPLSLPITAPGGGGGGGSSGQDESPYLAMLPSASVSPGGGRASLSAGCDDAYLPMFYSPGGVAGGADTPDGGLTSPTASQGHRGYHSRDPSSTEESYGPVFGGGADLGSDDGSYMPMKLGVGHVLDDVSHSRGSSVAEPDGYMAAKVMHGHLPFPADSSSAYVDVQPGKRTSKISDDSYAEVSPASSCSLTSGTPQSEAHLERAPLTVLTPPAESAASAGRGVGAPPSAAERHNRGDTDSMRTRASSLGSRLSQALMPRRRDRSESDSNSTERPSTGEPGVTTSSAPPCGSPSLSSSLDSTVTSLKEYYRRRRKGSELRETGSPAAESKGSQDSLRHRPRSNSQSSQGSDKTHSGWRYLFKRRDKKNGSVPVDVPAWSGSPTVAHGSRSPGPADASAHPPRHPEPDTAYMATATRSAGGGGGGNRRRRSKRREQPPAANYTDDDYLVMGPIHLDEETSSGSQADSLKRRRPAGRKAVAADDDDEPRYMPMEPAVRPAPVSSPLASPSGDYLTMDMNVRCTSTPAVSAGDYVNMKIGAVTAAAPSVMPAAAASASSSDYLAMTPRALAAPATSSAAAAAASATGDYLQMVSGGRPSVVPAVQRSQSARTSAEREPERQPAFGGRDPDTYFAVEVSARPVSALLAVQTEPANAERRKSDTAPLGERRGTGAGKVQRKNSSGGAGGGLLRKLDAMNPRAMFRSLSQRGKKEARQSPSEWRQTPPLDRSRSWLGSSQSLSSSSSIQEESESAEAAACGRPVVGAVEPESRLCSVSPCGSVASVTPRASLSGSQATTPRQTPTPTPTPLTTSNSLTNFGAVGPAPVRQRHESNPPPCSLQRPQRPQTGVGSQSLTTLSTEEQEVVYTSLDLAKNDSPAGQPPAGSHKLTYAKIDFDKSGTPKNKRDG